jgi:hypothetical protein
MIKASTTSKPMPVLSFLEGEGRDAAGRLIGEILALNDQNSNGVMISFNGCLLSLKNLLIICPAFLRFSVRPSFAELP